MAQKQTSSRVRRVRRAFALAGLVLLVPCAAAAQAGSWIEVVEAALPALRPLIPPGRAALDAEPLCTARLVGWSCPAGIRRAAEAQDLSLQSRDFTYICTEGQRGCRLLGVHALVTVTRPDVDGEHARVDAEVVTASRARSEPPQRRWHRFYLQRRRSGWEVVRAEPRP